MAAITSLVLPTLDGTKEYTFKPTGMIAPDTVDYVNASGVPDEDSGPTLPAIGRPRIRITTTQANANRNGKVTVQIDAPVLANTSASTSTGIEPPATRAYNPICKLEFFIPRQAGVLALGRIFELAAAVAQDSVVKDAVVNGERPW